MRPTVRCLVLFIIGIPVSLAGVSIDPKLWTVWISYLGAALLLTGIDAVLAHPKRRMRVKVEPPEQIFIGETMPAKLSVSVPSRRSSTINVLPELAADFEPQREAAVALRSENRTATATHDIPLSPRRRGDHEIKAIHLRWRGP